ncbi:MAG: hypothetical protein GW839_11450 [Flavobacteriales bacterium]|nr:hypothetical protein [Flavobacteriia bacterium]NCP05745.1 hypothetical protein [Flavobacteriales bacterium]PIV94525.1 MAG: hypothetical protein COW44_03720 [Flavobacteriaceae bacterium CG17_big_fil_post_rev_8_21_14_2_50_33_15]PIY10668.1 MAG: hypothetical protein COZ17_09130 [Flavobacteriaceae bacterium CG_4_10_14_3_um_filter_33_47]PJB18132.1 MAG: hypothetical protein CO117_09110 [Flavobacteriaceae bacterium CG_4_9_14_3_um_filter_33_16]
MNRNHVILLLVFSLSISVFAQDIKDTIAKETCECVSKFDTDAMNSSDLELNFGLCMLESYNKHINEFAENEKLDYENNAQMENFGEVIATRMLEFCPKMILKLGKNLNEAPISKDLTIEGVFNGTNPEAFFNVIIKEPTGKTTKLILLDYFENAYLITDRLLKSNQEVIVTYYEANLFDSNLNSFVATKIITNIITK